jgi:hypothetical protein
MQGIAVIEGACHCGAVRFTYAPVPEGATACNCTACRRYGALWIYDFENEGIRVTGTTHHYVRGKALEFHFCPTCANVVCWRGQNLDEEGRRRMAVNVRLCEPAAVAGIAIDHFDGLDAFDDLPRDGKCVADYWF